MLRTILILILLLCLSVVPTIGAMTHRLSLPGTVFAEVVLYQRGGGGPFGSRRDRPTQAEVDFEKAREKALKKEKYESLKTDTDRLLALATELKESVDKTSENTLSLDVIKKTEEVEKLAKKVREKMKGY